MSPALHETYIPRITVYSGASSELFGSVEDASRMLGLARTFGKLIDRALIRTALGIWIVDPKTPGAVPVPGCLEPEILSAAVPLWGGRE